MSPKSCIFSNAMNQSLDLVLLASPSAAFLYLLIFGPCIFNMLVKFVSLNSSRQEHPLANTQTVLEQAASSFSGLSPPSINAPRGPQAVLPLRSYRENTPVIGKLKGDHHQHLTWRCPNTSGLGTVFRHIARETLKKTPIPLGHWVHPCQPGDEVWVKKQNPFSQFGQALTRSSWWPLLLIKLQASSLGSTTPESRRQQLLVMRTPGKQLGTPKTSSSSSSKNNGPHPRRTLSPALVTPEADWSTHSTSLRFSRTAPATLWHLAGQCMAEAWGSGCRNMDGFSLSALASIPNRH